MRVLEFILTLDLRIRVWIINFRTWRINRRIRKIEAEIAAEDRKFNEWLDRVSKPVDPWYPK